MMQDPRARVTVRRFLRQWLRIDEVATIQRDATRYPAWNAPLKASLQEEATRFVESFFWSNSAFAEAIGAPYTIADRRCGSSACKRVRDTAEGDRDLLYNSIVLNGRDVAQGWRHNLRQSAAHPRR